MLLPHIARHTLGVVAVGARHYIDWLGVLRRSVLVFMIIKVHVADIHAIFFLFQIRCLVCLELDHLDSVESTHYQPENSPDFVKKRASHLVHRKTAFRHFPLHGSSALRKTCYTIDSRKVPSALVCRLGHSCGLFTCTLPGSPAERIADQKFAIKTLSTLYRHSTELSDHPDRGVEKHHHHLTNPTRLVKQALKGVRFAATTTTTALGNVATEIAGRCAHLVLRQLGIRSFR
jgi:hypothetical protein